MNKLNMMTDWLTKLEALEKEAKPGFFVVISYEVGGRKWPEVRNNYHHFVGEFSADDLKTPELLCHLRNRSKEIAALVKSVVELFSLGDYCAVCEDDFEDRTNCEYCQKVWAANKALNNLLREGE